jgi:hypothetical protein
MIPQENQETWAAEITMLAGDANKTLLAAPTGNRKAIVVTHLVAHVLVSAAQTVDIKIGSVNVARLAASVAVGTETFRGPMIKGLAGQTGQALTITPSAAGVSLHVVAEGYYTT